MSSADGAVLAILLAFALWGAVRGPVRQLLSLGLVVVAFVLAPRLAPRLEPLVGKVGGLVPAENAALAWGLSIFLLLVAGGLLLAAAGRFIRRLGAGGGAGRALGAALGAIKGAAVLLIVGYALLAWPTGDGGGAIALRRDGAPPVTRTDPLPSWRETLRRSEAAGWLVRGGRALRGAVRLPPWVGDAMQAVEAEVHASR